ncbi:MAG: aminotransferase class V-fold PLP-dependent enzyme [Candidatus Thiodiazotropha sp. (ex Epidulcina cf. delphinae)]|nr:aminotransferase class V-fold PLP-dependent enzyme [Candidatus Thiodiazotropha sp. (ex Epidulcina cf. delphinae)]
MFFALDPDIIYLNHAAVAPWPNRTREAVCSFARENNRQGSIDYPRWLRAEDSLRSLLAELIHAPDLADIALLKSTSEGLSLIAHGLDWQPGDNIVSIAQEFPSNRIVWESLKGQGVEVRLLDLQQAGNDPERELVALCDNHTRLLAVSSVQYADGRRMQLDTLGAYCRQRCTLFVVDAIQSLGALPFDLRQSQADVVVADGHKWMLGPEGLALFYCRPELRDKLRLHQYGWHMIQAMGDFDRTDWCPADTARRFECGSSNMLGVHALQASLSLILEIGLEKIFSRIQANTDEIIEQVDALGFELLTPRAHDKRAGIVTFRVPEKDNQALYHRLMEQRVVCAYRGGGIRFSPHFHNTIEQIRTAFARLRELHG